MMLKQMKTLLLFIFLTWGAICAAFFLGFLGSSAYYSPESLLDLKLSLMVICMFLSSLSFYFIGYKERIKIKYLIVCIGAISANIVYLFFWSYEQISVYDINLAGLIVLLLIWLSKKTKSKSMGSESEQSPRNK